MTEELSTYVGEYIWFDDSHRFRSKTRTVVTKFLGVETGMYQWPEWNYDGSSTGQADGSYSEVILKPVRIVKDPFRQNEHFGFKGFNTYCFLVLCDTYYPDGTPTKVNKRLEAKRLFEQNIEHEPWFGIEQEYFMIDGRPDHENGNGYKPLGFPSVKTPFSNPDPQGKYYCGVGHNTVYGRELAEKHYRYCLLAGLKISGLNAEVAPGQWEFQIGPCEGIESGDHLWLARYILVRLSEEFGVTINFHPKPVQGDWNGSGCHTNYSTHYMREGCEEKNMTGLDVINEAIELLRAKHSEHMEVYGVDNNMRMTGQHETSNYATFTNGVANRGCSVRIPTMVLKDEKGYFEDRRPSSNCDPYLVTSKLFETTVIKKDFLQNVANSDDVRVNVADEAGEPQGEGEGNGSV